MGECSKCYLKVSENEIAIFIRIFRFKYRRGEGVEVTLGLREFG